MVLLSDPVLAHSDLNIADIPVYGVHGNGAVHRYQDQQTTRKSADHKRDGGPSSNAFHTVNINW